MKKIIIAPARYIQGPNEVDNLAAYYSKLGNKKAFLAIDKIVRGKHEDIITASFKKDNVPFHAEEFGGECSKKEINRLMDIAKKEGCDVIIGLGGGKTIDAAKAVAYNMNIPVIIAPTIASTDAPTSALTVLYTEDGIFEEYLLLPSNPNCVVIDTNIIAQAPTRLLVAGMGDALSTYFEARSCSAGNNTAMAGGYTSHTAMTLARLAYDVLLENGVKAMLSSDAEANSHALDAIIEANTYLSGIGFESGGLGAAHAVHNGLTVLPEVHEYYHGEKVAFGTIVHLVLENAASEEIATVMEFCKSVGLPTTLKELGIKDTSKIMEVAEAACAEGETIHNMPFKVTPELVYSAIIVADKLGQEDYD